MRHILRCLLLAAVVHRAPSAALADASQLDAQKSIARQNLPRLDSFGDPLPEGVHYRLGTVRLRHQDLQTMFFSADGSKMLSQGWTKELRLWDVATGKLEAQLPVPENLVGHMNHCRHLIASPNDRYLACVAFFGQIILLDKATAKELARWEATCISLAFSEDSRELIGLTPDVTVIRWSTTDRKEVSRTKLDTAMTDVKKTPGHMQLSPSGAIAAFLASPSEGQRFALWHFWDTKTGKQNRPPLQGDAITRRLAWSADDRHLAMATQGDDLNVWDLVNGKRLVLDASKFEAKRPQGTDGIQSASIHGGKLLAVSRLNRVVVWDLEARKPLWEHDVSATTQAFSKDGKTLAVGGGSTILLFESATGKRVGFSQGDPGYNSPAQAWGWGSAVFCWDGRSFFVHDEAGISQIDTATGKRIHSISDRKHGFSYGGLCDNGRNFLRVGDDKEGKAHVFMMDASTGKELWRRPKQPMAIYAATNCETLALLSWDETQFTLLDARTGRQLKNLPPPVYRDDGPYCMTFSGDLRLAASAHNKGSLNLWDVFTGKKLRTMECPPGAAEGSLKFSADDKLIVCTTTHRMKGERMECGGVWEVETGQKLRSFDVPAYQLSPDRRWLAQEDNKGIAIRHLQTGRLMATVAGSFPSADSRPLTFSPDGSMVAVSRKDWTEMGLWDTFTGQQLRTWHSPLHQFHRAIFSPDGRTLLLSERGGTIHVCDVTGLAAPPGMLPAQKLTQTDVDRLWLNLTSTDGPRSHHARWTLAAGGEAAVMMLQRQLRPVNRPNAKQIATLIDSLDSSDFKTRQQASHTLERMDTARQALQEALLRVRGLEMKRRIELILSAQENVPWTAELRRELRGVLLLEQIGSPPARKLLQELARGAAGATLTEEAQAALQRLKLSDGTS